MLLGPTNPQRPWHEYHSLMLRWYDHWLKGHDTGLLDEPPILMSVPHRGTWRREREWPLARARRTRYFPHRNGRLDTSAPAPTNHPPPSSSSRHSTAVKSPPCATTPNNSTKTSK
ncbi:MAG: hypothetical protein LC635_02275 [Pseudonocardiaceae bacterium]|nr:hypothetical protein [Pseudonocardiaceae bacterium]